MSQIEPISITYKNVKNIKFPVYGIPKANAEFHFIDGILFLNGLALDDRNMSGETLGIRRLQTYMEVYPINRAITDYLALLSNKKHNYYIDSHGKLFNYKKTKFVQIQYFKILETEEVPNGTKIILRGLKGEYITPRPPKMGYLWVGIIILDGYPWKILDYTLDKEENRRIKI